MPYSNDVCLLFRVSIEYIGRCGVHLREAQAAAPPRGPSPRRRERSGAKEQEQRNSFLLRAEQSVSLSTASFRYI